MNNFRQKNNFKHCANCYLTINDIVYTQWTDSCPNKESAKNIKKELQLQGYKAIIRLIDKCFYRVYKEVRNE